MSEINYPKINISRFELGGQDGETVNTYTPSFLKMTVRTDSTPIIMGIVRKSEDVISGDVQDEIDMLNQEADIINSVISGNSGSSTEFSTVNIGRNAAYRPKIIGHTQYVPTEPPVNAIWDPARPTLSEHTDVSRLLGCLQYSPNYNEDQQRALLTGAVNKLAEWLDGMIADYQNRVWDGMANGESEVKLSFLLRLRKQIENCDFPVGFGNDQIYEDYANHNPGSMILGSYSSVIDPTQYLNPTTNAEGNNAAINHTEREILLNAAAYIPPRLYASEAQLRAAIAAGEPVTAGDILMASPTFYSNYSQVYLASVLAHEFIHATHIIDEAITYNMCETIEDDFRNLPVFEGWDPATQYEITNAGITDTILNLNNLNGITYGQAYIPLGINATSGLGFHDLQTQGTGNNSVVGHGFYENCQYSPWLYDFKGDTNALGDKIYYSYDYLDCYNNDPALALQAIQKELNNFSAYT